MGPPHMGPPHTGTPHTGTLHTGLPHTGTLHTGTPHKGTLNSQTLHWGLLNLSHERYWPVVVSCVQVTCAWIYASLCVCLFFFRFSGHFLEVNIRLTPSLVNGLGKYFIFSFIFCKKKIFKTVAQSSVWENILVKLPGFGEIRNSVSLMAPEQLDVHLGWRLVAIKGQINFQSCLEHSPKRLSGTVPMPSVPYHTSYFCFSNLC